MRKKYKILLGLNRLNNEEGSMLVLGLVVAGSLMVASSSFLGRVAAEARQTEKTFRSSVAIHLAEAGVDAAIWEINYGGADFSGWTGTNPVIQTATVQASNGDVLGTYTVSVTDPTGSSPIIESVGAAQHQGGSAEQRSVEVVLASAASATYTMAVFANDSITMSSNSCTDSFDSSLGPYDDHGADQNVGSNGDIGTNATGGGDISLDSNSEIDGDAYVGVGGNPSSVITMGSNSDVTGSESALSSPVEIPSITAPTGLTNLGDQTYDGNGNYTISSSGQYGELKFDGNTTITISGDVVLYITDAFIMDSNSDLLISSGSSLEIYVDNSFSMSSNTNVNNNTQDPSNFTVYGTDSMTGSEAIKLDSNTEIYGIIHTKNAGVKLSSNAEVFGAVLADTVSLDSNTCVHYDENLMNSSSSSGASAEVASWQEK